MKKGLIIFTAVCAIITGITLASCSNMLEDLRKAGKKNKDNRTEYTEDLLETVPDGSKKTNRVRITVDTGDKEIEKTGYVFSEPDAEKNWKNAEEVLTDSGFTGITKDSDGKYIITATRNGEYTVAVKDKDGNKKYETVKVDSIIPVNVDIPEVSIKKTGQPFDVTITGLNIDSDDFDSDAFRVVCTDSSGNEVTEVTDGAVISRNNDGSIKVTLTIPENRGEYEIKIECNTKEYGDVSLNGTLNVDIIYYTVTFNTNGGSKVEAQKVEEGTKVQKPANPGKNEDGSLFSFQCWCYENGTEYNYNTDVNSNITLYAKWNVTLDFAYYEKLVINENCVQFGAWPQTIKANNVAIDEKISCTQGMFTFYKGNDGWYVKCTENNGHHLKYSDGSDVGKRDRYFKLEPIKWRVLTTDYNGTGKALLLAENTLYAMAYYDGGNANRAVSDNNYEHSQVRAFLNGLTYTLNDGQNTEWNGKGFLQTAFTQKAAGNIATTTVINNETSTNPANDSKGINNGTNQYASDTPTNDKIFLLSVQEITNKDDYGFNENYNDSAKDGKRALRVTDFAKANGIWTKAETDYGDWWLRSPNYNTFSCVVNVINYDGSSYAKNVGTNVGVVPALTIDLQGSTSQFDLYSYTITFDSDGGSTVPQQTVNKGEKVQKPEDPIKTDGDGNLYEFLGWYNGGTEYNFDAPVGTDMKLKANWKIIEVLEGYTGKTIEFGSWPQSEANVTGITLTDTGKMYDGKNKEYSDNDGNYYVNVGDKYYKVEPIKWRVIAYYLDGSKLLLADKIYTILAYYGDNHNVRSLGENTIYPNNYKYSNIRAYLNSTKNQFEIDGGSYTEYDVDWTDKGFLTSAFTDDELEKIKTTAVDNSTATMDKSSYMYACDNTGDKVFLLSYKDQKPLYGLDNNENRIMQLTAYAKANGTIFTDNDWNLRSPSWNEQGVYRVSNKGNYVGNYTLVSPKEGVVPALIVNNLYTVTFDTDGGSTVSQQTVNKGEKVVKPAVPIKTDDEDNLYEFQGWYDTNGTEYDFSTPVNTDITLKAQWNKIKITSGYTREKYSFGSWPQSKAENITDGNLTPTGKKYDGENEEYKDADNNYYVKVGKTYYNVEPIKWRVIATYSDGRKLLLADKIYSRIPYYGTTSNRDLSGTTIYPSNYKYSNIRAYLNSTRNQFEIDGGSPTEYDVDWAGKGFLTSAFTGDELAKIKTTAVDNSAASTGYDPNEYACENTEDKVFLMSYRETQNELYGLSKNADRIMQATDYARANGAGGYWWLRSPYYNYSYYARFIDYDGINYFDPVDFRNVGVVPALTVTE